MRKIEASPRYKRDRKRCKKKGWNMKLLEEVELILATRPFTESEIHSYNVHSLSNNLQGHTALHIGARNSNWVLVYQVVGDTVKFEETYVVLDMTGTHDDCYGAEYLDDELVWL